MSGMIKPIRKLQDKTTPGFLKFTHDYDLGRTFSNLANPKLPKVPDFPVAPTIDEAQRNRDQQDRLRRRRGVLANIFGGARPASAGGNALLGGGG
jgi:hypothetical protein